jgi:hypothetical protein
MILFNDVVEILDLSAKVLTGRHSSAYTRSGEYAITPAASQAVVKEGADAARLQSSVVQVSASNALASRTMAVAG